MEIMTDCANPGTKPTSSTKITAGRVLAYTVSIGFMLFGFCIMLAFSGPVYIEPHFEHTAKMILGLGLLCLLGGVRIAVSLPSGFEDSRDMRMLKLLSSLGMALGALIIVMGVWGRFMS